jgi:hypothetical protein
MVGQNKAIMQIFTVAEAIITSHEFYYGRI